MCDIWELKQQIILEIILSNKMGNLLDFIPCQCTSVLSFNLTVVYCVFKLFQDQKIGNGVYQSFTR